MMNELFEDPVYVHEAVENAIRTLWERDGDLLRCGAHEQAITHRLALYMEPFFPNMHVDCEYNRDMSETKRINGVVVRPDIIVHQRGTANNLVALEVKTDHSHASRGTDREKLKALRNEHDYRWTALILIGPESASLYWGDREDEMSIQRSRL